MSTTPRPGSICLIEQNGAPGAPKRVWVPAEKHVVKRLEEAEARIEDLLAEIRRLESELERMILGEPAGEVIIGPESPTSGGYTIVEWVKGCPPRGTKLYTK